MKRILSYMIVTLLLAMCGLGAHAQSPQTGVYRIQNVGSKLYVKVTGKYAAEPNESAQAEASKITVGVAGVLDDGTYKMNSLASTYTTADGQTQSVEVYDYVTRAIHIGNAVLRQEIASSSDENKAKAEQAMDKFITDNAHMRLYPVAGKASTYRAVATIPNLPDEVLDWMVKKGKIAEPTQTAAYAYLCSLVEQYLGKSQTDADLKAKVLRNLRKVALGKTYLLGADGYPSFDYVEADAHFAPIAGSGKADDYFQWKLIAKVSANALQDGTYQVRNLGNERYVEVLKKYYAKPDALEADASNIDLAFGQRSDDGSVKLTKLAAIEKEGNTYVDCYSYIDRAITLGKYAIAAVLNGDYEGVREASADNIAKAQAYLEKYLHENVYMSVKPVAGQDEAVYAFATIPTVPQEVADQMKAHGAITEATPEAAWQFGVNYVKRYLDKSSTDSKLKQVVLNNIDKIKQGHTYYLTADNDGAENGFGYVDATEADLTSKSLMWGVIAQEVQPENLASGTYKIHNVGNNKYVKIRSKYYARPDATEAEASDVHLGFAGKLPDGSYKLNSLAGTDPATGKLVECYSYIDKALSLGKIAIATILKGDYTDSEGNTTRQASDENVKKAQDYLDKFMHDNIYMRVKPVAGANYVYALATIPVIPDEVVEAMYNHGSIKEKTADAAWNFLVDYVKQYLGSSQTDSDVKAYVLKAINSIKQGHTYYLSADNDGAQDGFGYVDADNYSSTDKSIEWGLDQVKADAAIESGFYKIQNVATRKWVDVKSKYYAAPDVDEAQATPVHVGIDSQLPDGGYKLNSLAGTDNNGNYIECYNYIAHAIELGKQVVLANLKSSSDENKQKATDYFENFIKTNAYMKIRLVPNQDSAFYAYATFPAIPADIKTIIVEHVNREAGSTVIANNDGVWQWLIDQVKVYLNKAGNATDSKLKSMVLNNIDKIKEGHTYYLRADVTTATGVNTFGIEDGNTADLSDTHLWWGMAKANPGKGVTGWFRIRNAKGTDSGKAYVNVTGNFTAEPDLTAQQAKSQAGTVIYVDMGDSADGVKFPIKALRSQGVNVNTYIDATMALANQLVLPIVTEKLTEIVKNNPNYSKYASLVEPAIKALAQSVDVNYYATPVFTATGNKAFEVSAKVPDVAEYCDMANMALKVMGKTKTQLVNKINSMKSGDGGIKDRVLEIAAQCANRIDNPDQLWDYMTSKVCDVVKNHPNVLPERINNLILNNLKNVKYGTTYCLTQEDKYATFDFQEASEAAGNEAAKWVLEPFDPKAEGYSTTAYYPYLDVTPEQHYSSSTLDGATVDDSWNYTTGYYDFDAAVADPANGTTEAYKALSTERVTRNIGNGKTQVYYLVKLENAMQGNVIPVQTPVVLRTQKGKIQLVPQGTPASFDYSNMGGDVPDGADVESIDAYQKFFNMLIGKIPGGSGAPRKKVITTTSAADNLLAASFFGDAVPSDAAGAYLPLSVKTRVDDLQGKGTDKQYLNMQGLGFWKDAVSKMEPNKAYLDGNAQSTNWDANVTFDNSNANVAPGYILELTSGGSTVVTHVDDVTVAKTVKSVRYYNVAGIETSEPQAGVNIVVTTYTDGTKTTTKVLK